MTLPHWTIKTERVPFVITYNTALCSISSIIRKHVHFHILISSPHCYNLFKAALIEQLIDVVATSVILQLGPNFAIPHNTTSPGAHTHAEKTVLLANTYLTENLHAHSTLQVKPDLSLITSTVDSKNVIYKIQCNYCSKQYIGETRRRLKDRFNEHRRLLDNPSQ